MDQEVSLLDLPADVYILLLPYLDGASSARLAQSCKFLHHVLIDADGAFRGLSHRRWGALACRLSARHGGSWRAYYYERAHCASAARTVRVVALGASGAQIVRLSGAAAHPSLTLASAALCASPDGRFVAAESEDDGTIVVHDLRTGAVHATLESHGAVVYMYWDASSTMVTWIASTYGYTLSLHAADVAPATPVQTVMPMRGAPFFWHMCGAGDVTHALAHVNGRVVRFDLRAATAHAIAALPHAAFQVPQMCHDANPQTCIVAHAPRGPGGGATLVRIAAVERASAAQLALLAELDALPDSDARLLCRFDDGDRVRFQITPDGSRVVAGVYDESFLTQITEIDLQTRRRRVIPIDHTRPVSLFVSPDSRMYLFLGVDGMFFRHTVYDCASGTFKTGTTVSAAHRMLHNRIPFNAAYALSHNPWYPQDSRCFVYADNDDGVLCQHVVRNADGSGFELPLPVLLLPHYSAGAAWYV